MKKITFYFLISLNVFSIQSQEIEKAINDKNKSLALINAFVNSTYQGNSVTDFSDYNIDTKKVDKYTSPPQNDLQKFYRESGADQLNLHEVPSYSEKLLKMMEYIPEGKSAHEVIENIPKEFRPTSGYKNTYKRILWNEPAPTVTRNFSVPSSSNCIHPFQNRALSPREAARLQTFPDDYPFEGNKQDIRIMIGNAVPLFLGLALALRIAGTYENYSLDDSSVSNLLRINNLLNTYSEEEKWKKSSLTRKKLESYRVLL